MFSQIYAENFKNYFLKQHTKLVWTYWNVSTIFFSLPFTHLHDRIWIKRLSNKKKHLPFICIHLMVAVQFKKRSQFSNNIMQTYVTSTKLHEQEWSAESQWQRAVRAEIIAFTAFDSAELRTGPTVTGPRAKVQNIQLNAHKTP